MHALIKLRPSIALKPQHSRILYSSFTAPVGEGDRTLPIAAMAGDRERWLATGMDDYLSKPLKRAELRALVDRICPGLSASEEVEEPLKMAKSNPPPCRRNLMKAQCDTLLPVDDHACRYQSQRQRGRSGLPNIRRFS